MIPYVVKIENGQTLTCEFGVRYRFCKKRKKKSDICERSRNSSTTDKEVTRFLYTKAPMKTRLLTFPNWRNALVLDAKSKENM